MRVNEGYRAGSRDGEGKEGCGQKVACKEAADAKTDDVNVACGRKDGNAKEW